MSKWYKEDKDRITRNVVIDPESGCWNWKLQLNRNGYGRLKYKGKKVRAHIFSYKVFKEPIPQGMLVCHHCDNKGCVNPDHLFLGSLQDNMDDMVRKNRQCKGSRHWKSRNNKLEELVIRGLRKLGYSQGGIAKFIGCSQYYVSSLEK